MVIQTRRGFLTGLVGALAAPAIVKAEFLMPVKSFELPSAPVIMTLPEYGDFLREELSNLIWQIMPAETPFLTLIKSQSFNSESHD